MRVIVILFFCLIVAACAGGDRATYNSGKPTAKEALQQHRNALRAQLLASLQGQEEGQEQSETPKSSTPKTDAEWDAYLTLQAQSPNAGLPSGERGYRTVALLAPFSGSDAVLGDSLLNAASLAMFENPDVRINLLSLDSGRGMDKAIETAALQSATAIIGPVRASEVQQAEKSLQRYGAPVFSLSNSAAIGKGVIYPMGFAPEDQVRVALDYLARQGKKRLAVMAPDNRYGQLIVSTARQYADNESISLRQISLYPTDIGDFTPFIEQLKSFRISTDLTEFYEDIDAGQENIVTYSGIDAILLAPVRSQNLRILAAQLDSENFVAPHVQIIGLQLWDNFGALEKEPSLDSAIWISAESEQSAEFKNRYRKVFRQNPHDLASIAYDIMNMLAALENQGGISKGSLVSDNDFAGINGEFSPQSNGKVKRNYYIKRIKGRNVELLPQPQTQPQTQPQVKP